MSDINPQVIISAKDEASGVLNRFSQNASGVGTSIKNTLTNNVVQLGSVFAATTAVITTSIAAYTESQNVTAQLDSVLKSTGATAGVTKQQVLDLASSLQQQSKFGDEAIVSAQNLLLTFTNIGSKVFPDATKTSLDMAQALGMDLTSATRLVGKALNDPIDGLSALSRVGVQFTDQQKTQIATLVESGKTMEAQGLIVDVLGQKFGGSALAASQTFEGQMVVLGNTVNDVQETIGQALLESLIGALGGVDGITTGVKKFNDFLVEHKEVLLGITIAILAVAVVMGGLFLAAIIAVTGASAALVAGITAVVAIVGFAAGVIIAKWGDIKKGLDDTVSGMRKVWEDFINFFLNIGNNIRTGFNNILNDTKNKFDSFIQDIKNKLESLMPSFNAAFGASGLNLPGFDTGGIVPGPIGSPQLAMVHGGEEIRPYRGSGSNNTNNNSLTLNVQIGMYAGSSIEKRNIAEALYKELVTLAQSKNKSVSELLGA